MGELEIAELDEALKNALAARKYMYNLFWLALANESGAEAIRALGEPLATEACSILSDGSDGLTYAQETMRSDYERICASSTDSAESIRLAYTATFIGPGKLPSYPWESMHVEKQPGLFLESTLAVRRAYARYDLKTMHQNAEPDDHIATELNFMALLGELSLDAAQREDGESLRSLLKDSSDFLDDHLSRWIGDYAQVIAEDAFAPLFADVLLYASAFVNADQEFLGSCLERFDNARL